MNDNKTIHSINNKSFTVVARRVLVLPCKITYHNIQRQKQKKQVIHLIYIYLYQIVIGFGFGFGYVIWIWICDL